MMRLTIPGPPVGKVDSRSTRLGHRYSDPEVKAFYRTIAHYVYASGWRPGKPVLAGLVAIVGVKARPKRKPTDYPFDWTRGRNPCVARPDADNLAKNVLDGLQFAGVWTDDGVVCGLSVRKFYAAESEGPSTEIVVLDMARDVADYARWTDAAG